MTKNTRSYEDKVPEGFENNVKVYSMDMIDTEIFFLPTLSLDKKRTDMPVSLFLFTNIFEDAQSEDEGSERILCCSDLQCANKVSFIRYFETG